MYSFIYTLEFINLFMYVLQLVYLFMYHVYMWFGSRGLIRVPRTCGLVRVPRTCGLVRVQENIKTLKL